MEPDRKQRMAAIGAVVTEYTELLSAGHYSLFGAAPWRTHAERAFLAHYRNLDRFLLRERREDEVVAGDYLEPGAARDWELPTWAAEWREAAPERLGELRYGRLDGKPWTPHRCVPPLEAEARAAWKQFYDAVRDGEYREEFVRQVEARRRELVPFHVRVELLYL